MAFPIGLCLAGLAIGPGTAFGFTQGVKHGQSVIPMGHEWITRLAAIEVLGGERALPTDTKDPRLDWPKDSLATDISLQGAEAEARRIRELVIPKAADDRFAAIYKPVFDAIIGERWVDIGGVNLAEARTFDRTDCLDAVTQEAPDIQYDHFMRMPSDVDGEGGVHAAQQSAQRFVNYFVAAAMAKDGEIQVWDGGGWSVKVSVDRHYFMFGRALHLFEDSFSPDHTVRVRDDYFRRVRQVKSYLCASGSEQHAHASPLSPSERGKFLASGDVIWKSMEGRTGADDWSAYPPSNMRDYALAATEGTKEVWAAFIRSMAKPVASREAFARQEAQKVAAKWLGFDAAEMRAWYSVEAHRGSSPLSTYVKASPQHSSEDGGKGTTIDQCMKRDWKGASQASKLTAFAESRRKCLYNMLPSSGDGDKDPSLHLAFDWRWRNPLQLENPPKDWQITTPNLVTVQVKLANRVNQTYMRSEGNGYIYNDPKPNPNTVVFDITYDPSIPLAQNNIRFAVNGQKGKFLSRAGDSWGRVDIYSGDDKGHFSLERRADGYYGIKNIDDNMYMYMYTNAKTYINSDGNPDKHDSQWRVDGLPEPYLVSGTYITTFQRYSQKATGTSNGKLVVGPNGFRTNWYLERQSDGSYQIRLPSQTVRGGDYVVENADHTLGVAPSNGTRFYLEQQQDGGDFAVRTADGRYWSTNPRVSGTPVTTTDLDACSWDPCMPGNLLGLSGASARGANARMALPPPECKTPATACPVPQIFSLSRDWASDDR